MADHFREQILDAIVTELQGAASLIAVHVTKNRVYPAPPANLPACNVEQSDDVLVSESYPYQEHTLDVRLALITHADDDAIEDANNLETEVHKTLRANRQLGLATNVHDSWWTGTDEPEITTEGKKPTVKLTIIWRVFYRTDVDDPSI